MALSGFFDADWGWPKSLSAKASDAAEVVKKPRRLSKGFIMSSLSDVLDPKSIGTAARGNEFISANLRRKLASGLLTSRSYAGLETVGSVSDNGLVWGESPIFVRTQPSSRASIGQDRRTQADRDRSSCAGYRPHTKAFEMFATMALETSWI